MGVTPENGEQRYIIAVISPDTFLGGLLKADGITYYPGPPNSDEWADTEHASRKLAESFGSIIDKAGFEGKVVIVADKAHRQYEVETVTQLKKVWIHGDIAYVLTMPRETYEKAKVGVAFAKIPE